MKRLRFALHAAAGLLTLLLSAPAVAALNCTSTIDLGDDGNGGVFMTTVNNKPTTCVKVQDKLFGNFVFGPTFIDDFSNIIFTLGVVNGKEHHQVAFNTSYLVGSTYTISYEIEVIPASPLVIVELDADFTQTAGTASNLLKNSVPLGNPPAGINQTKDSVNSSGNTKITYSPGVRSLAISETLTVNGTVSSVTNTVVQSGVVPRLVTTASAGGPLGTALTDQATLSGGFNPSGSITFRLYGPNDTNCTGTPVFTSNAITVNGNGNYTSAPAFTPAVAGVYRWIASYSGDPGNPPPNAPVTGACNDANETVTITTATPGIVTTASAGGPVGTALTDQATLSGGASPTGSIIFRLYGPNDATCTGTPVFTSNAIAVNGNGNYTSAPAFTPTAAGIYRWIASYSGDAANAAVAGVCNAANENVTLTPVTPAIATTASAGGPAGTVLTDQATLSGGVNPTGSITFRLYGPNDATCTGTPVFTSSAVAVNGNGTYTSAPGFTATAVGAYRWIASYSGDAANAAVAGACNDANENATITPATPALVTTASAGGPIGTVLTDQATLSGGASPTGSITFRLYGPNDASCAGAPVFTSNAIAVSGNGTYTSAPGFTSAALGTYRWIASYSGDANNAAIPGACNGANESATITTAAPALVTTASAGGPIGTVLTDQATLSGGVNPTGSITFRLYGPNDASCTGAPVFTSNAIAVNGNGTYASAPGYTSTAVGTYRWIASYSGDANNVAIPGACNGANESATITQPPTKDRPIPTLSQWMLLALGLLLASFGLVAVRRTAR
jgi:hypothetical protein